ncbi:MAG: membrane or secreted protein [Bacteroidetes bacterium]|nr:membrane or secreted protein [Bacteroidota bacterium]
MFLKIILLSVVLIGLGMAGIAIKMFFQKNGEFKKQCSSVDVNGQKIGCSCGGGANSCENKSLAEQ